MTLISASGSQELLISDSSKPAASRRQGSLDRLSGFFLGRPAVLPLSRGQCHRILLDLKGVPRGMAGSSIELQLAHLSGLTHFGYAWLMQGSQAQVWYWSEANSNLPSGVLPCPEVLLRPVLADGLHLIQCLTGFEAAFIRSARLQRTRWFAQRPDAIVWQQFVRDSGLNPERHELPLAQSLVLRDRPQRLWSIRTTLLRPLAPRQWVWLAAVAIVGAVACALVAHTLKLNQRVFEMRTEYDALATKHATAIKLKQQVNGLQKQVSLIAAAQPTVSQIKVMAALAQPQLIGEEAKISIQEYEYRNKRIRLQFVVPEDGFVLGNFLEAIESIGLFSQVRLLPGTNALGVALQATLKGDNEVGRVDPPAP